MKKRMVSLLMALVVAFGLIPAISLTAAAEELEDKVVKEIHMHFPAGITEIALPKLGEKVADDFSFVYDAEDTGLNQVLTVDYFVLEASGAKATGNYGTKNYYEYIYIYADTSQGYRFPENLDEIVFTDPTVAAALVGFERDNQGQTGFLGLCRGTRVRACVEDIEITSTFPNLKPGDILDDPESYFSYSGQIALMGYGVYESDAQGNWEYLNSGDEIKKGYRYLISSIFTPISGHIFKEGLTEDDFPKLEGFETDYEEGDDAVFYTRSFDFYEYGVLVKGAENGTVTADKEKAMEGETVKLAATPAEGYGLDSVSVVTGDTPIALNEDLSFTMPAGAVVVTAIFARKEYTITFTGEEGVVKTVTAKHGEKIELPEPPAKEGYTVTWEQTPDSATGDMTVKAVYTKNPAPAPADPQNPPTGDNAEPLLLAAMMLVSLAGMLAITLGKKRISA